eukprot:472085_1
METIKKLFWRGWNLLKSFVTIFNRQTQLIKIASSICVGVGFLLINKLHNNYQYNKKQFELTPNNISKKAILITGCGSGIGKFTAKKLNKLGFIVIATCRRKESVDEYLSDKSFINNGSTSYQLDISLNDNILNVKQKIKLFLKENNYILWGIVNNAGVMTFGTFEFQTHEQIKKQIDVNIYGTINMCHAFVPLLYGRCNTINGYKSANGGRIVNISSVGAKFVIQSLCVYTSTKAAISHFSHGLRIELSSRFGIWCSTMELGAFKTNMVDAEKYSDEFDKLAKNAQDRDNISTFYDMKIENESKKALREVDKMADKNLDNAVDDIIHSLTAKYPKRTYKTSVPAMLHFLIYLVKKYESIERMICEQRGYSVVKQTK